MRLAGVCRLARYLSTTTGLSAARIQNLADLFTAYAPTRTNQLIGGALQIAIWEIVNEFDGNPFSLSSGQMRTTSADALMLTTAQNMLNSLGTPAVANHGNTAFLDYMIDGTYKSAGHDTVLVQDLVGFTAVPESSSFALGIAGILLPLVIWKVRGRKVRATV